MTGKLFKGYLYVISSAVIFGSMPLMTKLIYAEGANPMTVVALRNALALPVLAWMALRQAGSLSVPWNRMPKIALIAVLGCCATPYLLFSSYRFISSGTATVLHFIYPAMVVLGSAVFLRTGIGKWELVSVLVCVLGVAMFYTPGESVNWRGSVLAISSGGTFAAYVLLLSAFRRGNVSAMVLSFYVAAISAAVMFALCIITGQLAFPVSVKGWGLSVVFAFAVSAGAVVLFQFGTFLIGGQRASILSTLEPITSIIIGAAIFQEEPTWRTLTGAALVILAGILIALFDSKQKK